MSPERQGASLLTTAVELLRGDVPSVLKNLEKYMVGGIRSWKYLGSEYLNVQFGWMPLLRDVAGAVQTLLTLDRLIYNETTRRSRAWEGPSASSSGTSVLGFSDLSVNQLQYSRYGRQVTSGFGGPNSNWNTKTLWSQDYRLSSRLGGLARPTYSSNGFIDQAMHVMQGLGFVRDPKALWELTPFSWLVDWAVNIGSALENASYYSPQVGGRAIDYAYVTTKTVVALTHDFAGWGTIGSSFKEYRVIDPQSLLTTVTKERRRVSPFGGVGVDLSGLTSGQFSILVALGMARKR
jgi:hypothetical protein